MVVPRLGATWRVSLGEYVQGLPPCAGGTVCAGQACRLPCAECCGRSSALVQSVHRPTAYLSGRLCHVWTSPSSLRRNAHAYREGNNLIKHHQEGGRTKNRRNTRCVKKHAPTSTTHRRRQRTNKRTQQVPSPPFTPRFTIQPCTRSARLRRRPPPSSGPGRNAPAPSRRRARAE